MKVFCRTNLDVMREIWPTELPALPAIGNYIQSDRIRTDGGKLELQVVGVRWKSDQGKWYLEIELSLSPHRYNSMYDFQEWYKTNW